MTETNEKKKLAYFEIDSEAFPLETAIEKALYVCEELTELSDILVKRLAEENSYLVGDAERLKMQGAIITDYLFLISEKHSKIKDLFEAN